MMWLIGNNTTDVTDKRFILISLIKNRCQKISVISDRKNQCNQCKSFTFVELMITVVILTVGLILIIQGFITAAGALNTTQNRNVAMQFLESKMQEIEASAIKDNGVKREDSQGEFSDGVRNFNWNLEVVGVEKEEELDLSEDLNEVRLKVAWQEQNQPKDLSLVTYLKNKKE